jgi:hypothetical protein
MEIHKCTISIRLLQSSGKLYNYWKKVRM